MFGWKNFSNKKEGSKKSPILKDFRKKCDLNLKIFDHRGASAQIFFSPEASFGPKNVFAKISKNGSRRLEIFETLSISKILKKIIIAANWFLLQIFGFFLRPSPGQIFFVP